ncbi:MAG TPA: universal stress protein [Mycobacteriales bacterium]|nr:universal stress protein [Mycobacteriales bacterium]
MGAAHRRFRIVVGVDASAGAHAALKWAADEAIIRDGELIVVHAMDPAATTRAPYAPVPSDLDTARELAVREVDKVVTMVLAQADNLPAERRYVVDLPARALASACVDADLLVVGADEKGGSVGAGVTPRACLQNTICPTIVVPSSSRT